MAAAAALERRLIERDEILGFLLHLDIAVAQHAEGAVAARQEARKQPRQEHADHRLDANEADRCRPSARRGIERRQPDEAGQLARDRQQRVHGGAVALAPQLDADREPLVLDEGEGMRRIDRDRGQNRQIACAELALQPFLLGRRQLLALDDVDAGCRQLGLQAGPGLVLLAGQRCRELVDLGELLGRRQSVLAHLRDAGGDLAVQARRPHHVEFVEVGGRDRQEPQALQQRMALVERLFQNPTIELQPGQLAIEEARRTRGRCWPLGGFLLLELGLRRTHERPSVRAEMIGERRGRSVLSPNCRPHCRTDFSAIRRLKDTSQLNCLLVRFRLANAEPKPRRWSAFASHRTRSPLGTLQQHSATPR